MYRESLAPDRGMILIFHDDRQRTFWMKNTRIPLDIIFITKDRGIAGIVENAEPMTETPRRVNADSRFVLEVNGGLARTHGLAAGDRVYFFGFKE